VRLAFEMAHGSEPSDSQARQALDFLERYRQRLAAANAPAEQAWAALGRVLLTANAFLYLD
jgi:hypothetical protein